MAVFKLSGRSYRACTCFEALAPPPPHSDAVQFTGSQTCSPPSGVPECFALQVNPVNQARRFSLGRGLFGGRVSPAVDAKGQEGSHNKTT